MYEPPAYTVVPSVTSVTVWPEETSRSPSRPEPPPVEAFTRPMFPTTMRLVPVRAASISSSVTKSSSSEPTTCATLSLMTTNVPALESGLSATSVIVGGSLTTMRRSPSEPELGKPETGVNTTVVVMTVSLNVIV